MRTARVRNPLGPGNTRLHGYLLGYATPAGARHAHRPMELSVLDLVYVLGIFAAFALVGVIAWGVSKL
jgi:hypothetical protein